MTDRLPPSIEGSSIAPPDATFAIVAARFNEFIVDRLVAGCKDGLLRHGVSLESVTVVKVPGAFEIPHVAAHLVKSGKYSAVITLGAVIRGATPHFDHVAGEAASGIARLGVESSVPVIFGVLTTDTIEQAIERAGTKAGNKGFDAALAAIELVNVGRRLREHGI